MKKEKLSPQQLEEWEQKSDPFTINELLAALDTPEHNNIVPKRNFQYRHFPFSQNNVYFGNVCLSLNHIGRLFPKYDEPDFYSSWRRRIADNITVLTDEGKHRLGNIRQIKVDKSTGIASAKLNNKKEVVLYSRRSNDEFAPMQVEDTWHINVEKTPAISKIIADNADKMTALMKVAQIIVNKEDEEQIAELIPELKRELILIENVLSMELVDSVFIAQEMEELDNTGTQTFDN
ncbi:MAG: hypothetical protein IJ190_12215 [Prevotella sp.]|nr:hypothetical protein [Prevotella sp.]